MYNYMFVLFNSLILYKIKINFSNSKKYIVHIVNIQFFCDLKYLKVECSYDNIEIISEILILIQIVNTIWRHAVMMDIRSFGIYVTPNNL